VHHAHQFHGIVAQEGRVGVEVELARAGDGDVADGEAALGCQDLPGDDVAVVLHHAQHDGIARPQVGAAPRSGDEVDALGGVAREDYLAVGARVDERADLLTRTLVGIRRSLAEGVNAAVYVGVIMRVVGGHGVDDLARLLAAGRGIQKDQPLAGVRFLVEDGEVGPDAGDVEWIGVGVGHKYRIAFASCNAAITSIIPAASRAGQ